LSAKCVCVCSHSLLLGRGVDTVWDSRGKVRVRLRVRRRVLVLAAWCPCSSQLVVMVEVGGSGC